MLGVLNALRLEATGNNFVSNEFSQERTSTCEFRSVKPLRGCKVCGNFGLGEAKFKLSWRGKAVQLFLQVPAGLS